MIDTHIHIIPEVDDGARSLLEAVEMLEMAKSEGVSEIIATPHFKEGLSLDSDVLEQYEKIHFEAERLGVKLHLGNELYLCEEGVDALRDDHVYTMANSSYVLVELPFHHFYPFHEALIHQIQLRGFKIILAHIERYQIFRRQPAKLAAMMDKGIYGQMNARYVHERKTRKQALKWIEKGYVHVIASDGHNTDKRPPKLGDAYETVAAKFGVGAAELLFKDNPRRIIENEPLLDLEVEHKKKFFNFGSKKQ